MEEANETLVERLENLTCTTITSLVNSLFANRKYSYPIFSRDVIDTLYSLINALPIAEPRESAENLENIIWNFCLILDDDVRLNQTSRYGSLNYGWLTRMANEALRVVFLSGSLVEGSDTEQLWRSMKEYPKMLSRRRNRLKRSVYLWDACSYLHLLLAYRSRRDSEYDDKIIELSNRLVKELEDHVDLSAQLVGYMLVLLKMIEQDSIMIVISAFVALVSTKNIMKLQGSSFLLIFTLFILVLDFKYQKLKRGLYDRLKKLETELHFDVYRTIYKSDNPYYPLLLYAFLILGIAIWFYLA